VLSEEIILDRKRWVDELTSGRQIQITGDLHDKGKFCVMGVGGYLQEPESLINEELTEESIAEMYGLPRVAGSYLFHMNDGAPMSIRVGEKMEVVAGQAVLMSEYKTIREDAPSRSFEFMGRWLEIYTALERIYGQSNRTDF
jgi:hypothetical protein